MACVYNVVIGVQYYMTFAVYIVQSQNKQALLLY